MLLALREEILCLLILLFLILYYTTNKMRDRRSVFLTMAYLALTHVVFDLLTVISVNRLDSVPAAANNLFHICFYLSGVFFTYAMYLFIIQASGMYRLIRFSRRFAIIPPLLYTALVFFLPVEYRTGRGTNYSYGPLVILGYLLFVIYSLLGMAALLINRKKLDTRIRRSIIPMLSSMCALIILQAFIPELLMTGASVTLLCLGLFVAMDNPDKDYQKLATWDYLTGLKNRNCYNRDLLLYRHTGGKNRRRSARIGFLVADLNHLKHINDTLGHIEGDQYIRTAAGILKESLKTAENIYRIGGDEFVAIYLSPDDRTVRSEIAAVHAACAEHGDLSIPLRIATGFADGRLRDGLDAIFHLADQRMYECKADMKSNRK